VKILLVAATSPESDLIRTEMNLPAAEAGEWTGTEWKGHEIGLLHTGIGMVNTAYHLGRHFLKGQPDLAIQFGIAGSFKGAGPEIGEVVEVNREWYGDLGAESPEGFLMLEEMGFENFRAGSELFFNQVNNPQPWNLPFRSCTSITVNRVHGVQASIDEAVRTWSAHIENMEGAAFFQCCLMEGVRFLELRGISNYVEPRNRDNWKIKDACMAVQKACLETIANLDESK
jgi:futalosine hydrolase